jgi:hypothetical protein
MGHTYNDKGLDKRRNINIAMEFIGHFIPFYKRRFFKSTSSFDAVKAGIAEQAGLSQDVLFCMLIGDSFAANSKPGLFFLKKEKNM